MSIEVAYATSMLKFQRSGRNFITDSLDFTEKTENPNEARNKETKLEYEPRNKASNACDITSITSFVPWFEERLIECGFD